MPLVNKNVNTIPAYKIVKGSGAPPPVPTVNWKMVLEPVDPLNTFDVAGYQFNLTGPAGTNNIAGATAGPADPGFTFSIGPQTILAFGFSGEQFTVTAAGQHIVNLQMTNTNILPLGTSINGPNLIASSPTGATWNVDVYVRTLGYPAPGILTQQQAPADIVAYLIQL